MAGPTWVITTIGHHGANSLERELGLTTVAGVGADSRPHFWNPPVRNAASSHGGAIRAQGSGKAGQHLPRLSSLTDPSLDHVFGPKDLLCSGNAFPVPLLSRSASVILPQAFAYTQCSPP